MALIGFCFNFPCFKSFASLDEEIFEKSLSTSMDYSLDTQDHDEPGSSLSQVEINIPEFKVVPVSTQVQHIGSKPTNMVKKKHSDMAKISRMILELEGRQFVSAITTYGNGLNIETSWDNTSQFVQEIDQSVFNHPTSKVAYGAFAIGALLALPASTPSTGALLTAIGDFFHFQASGEISIAMSTWIMATTTPCFALHLGKRAKIIHESLFTKEVFKTHSDDTMSEPTRIKRSRVHKAAIGLLLISSVIDATVNTGVIWLAYHENFPNVFWGTSWSYFISFLNRYYEMGNLNLDRKFCQYWYDTKIVADKRATLLSYLRRCREALTENDNFTKEIYKVVKKAIDSKPSTEFDNQEHIFALSALFLKNANNFDIEERSNQGPVLENTPLLKEVTSLERENTQLKKRNHRLKEEVDELTRSNAHLMNFQAQQDSILPWKEAILEQLSTILMGAGWAGRAVAMEYILEKIFTAMTIPDPYANGLAWGLSIYDFLYRSFTENDIQQEYMKGWLNSLTHQHLGDTMIVRKVTGWSSMINGGLFSLAKTVAGIAGFSAWGTPAPLQAICLVPAFILDLSYYDAFFRDANQNIITEVITLKHPDPKKGGSLNRKRAVLMKYMATVEHYLTNVWDPETIGKLNFQVLKSF
ncbi:MAG: hypothetical protein H0U27_07405 [Nitrosopumilus sp.]|nr:hypothetical protein [Nitrosopumilus sp.]